MLKTPILFLIFNKPETTLQVFESIANTQPSALYIAADGARKNKTGEEEICKKIREDLLQKITWNCEIKTLFRDGNLGCRYAVSSAIDWFFSEVEEGIILEDDTLPNESFFSFCEEMLAHYRNDENIFQVCGANIQFGKKFGNASYYFSKYNYIWGWASWRRAWKFYDVEFEGFENKLENILEKTFADKQQKNYWRNAMNLVYNRTTDTWDHQWTYAMWKHNGACIVPQENLVTNIGFHPDALHTKQIDSVLSNIPTKELKNIIHPEKFYINDFADKHSFQKYIHPNSFGRLMRKYFKI